VKAMNLAGVPFGRAAARVHRRQAAGIVLERTLYKRLYRASHLIRCCSRSAWSVA
jgi:hypothetical protein